MFVGDPGGKTGIGPGGMVGGCPMGGLFVMGTMQSACRDLW